MRKRTIRLYLQSAAVLLVAAAGAVGPRAAGGGVTGFVKRDGGRLILNGRPFRFAGPNMHWLGLDESAGAPAYPSLYRLDDAFATAREMGATVVRTHAAISTGSTQCIEPALGVFNEEALRQLDLVIARAGAHGLRLILPLTDNYRYYHGGKYDFARWRGTTEYGFYTDPKVIGDFKQYIAAIVNRINTCTGTAYKDDPAILAWETGNELSFTEVSVPFPPVGWTRQIAEYLKRLDPNHLVIDGSYGVNPEALALASVDIVTDHFYPPDLDRLRKGAALAAAAGKVYLVGEYDWVNKNGGVPLATFLAAIEDPASGVAGDLYWELYGHHDAFGFVQHADGYALHYPGDTEDMRTRVREMRRHAYAMRGDGVPGEALPGAPSITGLTAAVDGNILRWRGGTGAYLYTVERSSAGPDGPWAVVRRDLTDNDTPWKDTTAPAGAVWYRVRGLNQAGEAGPYSPPAAVQAGEGPGGSAVLTDECDDFDKIFDRSANLRFDTTNTKYFAGDPSRIMRSAATVEYVIYRVPAPIRSFRAEIYFWPQESVVDNKFYVSKDGKTFTELNPDRENLGGDWIKIVYSAGVLPPEFTYLKIEFRNTAGQWWNPNLSRVEIIYEG